MKKFTRKLLALCLLFVLAAGISNVSLEAPGKQVTAATKKKSALKAYQKFLSQSKIQWGNNKYKKGSFGFKIKDLDGDKIPELLLTCNEGVAADGYERIYTYKKGVVNEVLEANHSRFCFYPGKHIVCETGAQSGDYFTRWYKMSNGKIKYVAGEEGREKVIEADTESDAGFQIEIHYKYYINKKKVSKASYNKYIKKLKGKEFKFDYIKNTKQNRKKYLKSS